ncbi:MAG: sensor histidine kinase [Phenylobacterium sp.]|uniref:sensor histidine kinase n=1 Tax=Phenylobacterium sp. TaxID=1871053 RepID=UPI0011FAF658|nr:sensor histidine kinase [Phenylobacterium sp.]TAJ73610.1 MAG: sensor histidine kinase [Phenylobacterium sp.]
MLADAPEPRRDPNAMEVTVTCAASTPFPETMPPQPDGRDTVIREMDHRIKNHLQLLAAYARVASKRRGLTVGELAEDMADKLAAIAGAHDALHRAGGRGFGLARPFLETLVAAFTGSRHRIYVDCDPALQLPAAELAPIGMIVSEAISNALKHAFPVGGDGRIWVRLTQEAGRVKLTVRDDGVGMTDLPGERISGRGLIDTLARQLGGYARLGSAPFGGALVSVIYPRIAAG